MGLTREEMTALNWDWSFWGRPDQMEPAGDWWSVWLAMAGRGYGKTRLGAEWIRKNVCGPSPMMGGKFGRIALIAETAADARDVMVSGPSGILACSPPDQRPRYIKSERRLEWPNGAIALTFSAEEPDQLRGPEHDLSWSDELAKWKYPDETWDMLQFGMRIGDRPRQLVTTTPRPIPIVRTLLQDEGKPNGVSVTRGRTYDNAANLAPSFIQKMRAKYEGTRLGRQELHAEVLDDVPGALWTRAMFDRRGSQNKRAALFGVGESVPTLERIVVGVDPSGTSGEDEDSGDDVGIVVVGKGVDGLGYILEDGTCQLGPAGWARHVVYLYEKWGADLVVGERNYGGAMVEYTIRTIRRNIAYRNVTATRGKVVRAQPVASMYEQGKIRHIGSFALLEDQMCSMTPSGYLGRGSPDRVDAAVWAITELFFGQSSGGGSTSIGGHH